MISLAAILLLPCVLTQAQAQSDLDRYRKYRYELDLIDDVLQRAEELRPARRDTPPRELNISDDEVREIQLLVAKLLPKSIVNISTVVSGCPCEEGPMCTDQVFILASQTRHTVGLQLSRIRNAWTVGAVQRWWLEYEDLARRSEKLTWNERHVEQLALAQKFPRCRKQTEGKQ